MFCPLCGANLDYEDCNCDKNKEIHPDELRELGLLKVKSNNTVNY